MASQRNLVAGTESGRTRRVSRKSIEDDTGRGSHCTNRRERVGQSGGGKCDRHGGEEKRREEKRVDQSMVVW